MYLWLYTPYSNPKETLRIGGLTFYAEREAIPPSESPADDSEGGKGGCDKIDDVLITCVKIDDKKV